MIPGLIFSSLLISLELQNNFHLSSPFSFARTPTMSFLFKPKQKTPAELVKVAKEAIAKLESGHGDSRKVRNLMTN
jgi:hypothetical protein